LTFYSQSKNEIISFGDGLVSGEIFLSDKKQIRARSVYTVITMISEISGFADLFVVFFTFLFGTFYTPLLLEHSLIKHMGPVDLPKKNKSKKQKELQKHMTPTPLKLSKAHVLSLISQISSYTNFRVNVVLLLSRICTPRRCYKKRTLKLFEIQDRGKTKIEKALTVSSIINMHDDL
jgi:hypothetical protein